ncbi:carboxylesterase family protein [Vibrio cholerae]
MTLTSRSLLTLSMTLVLAACGSEDSSPANPDKPQPLNPLPSEVVPLPVGNSTIDAIKESVVVTSLSGNEERVWVEAIKGVPYASYPERFTHSETTPLATELNATEFGSVCPQLRETEIEQSEECLNLNIWRPAGTVEGDQLPVYVFIHGGDFEYGAGSDPLIHGDTVVAQGDSDGKPFMVVTFNYRLGLLGTHWVKGSTQPDDTHSGNYAIGDQKSALKWIQTEIEKFGGDKEKITLVGQGAGAMSINLLQLSDSDAPTHMGYFHRAIMQSDISGFQYASYDQAEKTSDAVKESSMTLFGIEDVAELTSYRDVLKVQEAILNPVSKLTHWLSDDVTGIVSDHGSSMSLLAPFAPYIEYKKNVITTYPGYLLKTQPSAAESGYVVPTVIGSNRNESNTMSIVPNLASLIVPIVCKLKGCDDTPENEAQAILAWLQEDANAKQVNQGLQRAAFEHQDLDLGDLLDGLDPNVYEIITHLFFGLGNDTADNLLALTDYAKNDEHELGNAIKNMAQYRMMMNDMLFAGPAREKAIESAYSSMNSKDKGAFYQFDYTPSFNVWGYSQPEDGSLDILSMLNTVSCMSAACSASELPFVFNKPYTVNGLEIKPSKKDKALMSTLSRLWFSDELFTDYSYDAGTDTVMIIDEQGEVSLSRHWDKNTQMGLDPQLRNGRLTGLSEANILLGYFQ